MFVLWDWNCQSMRRGWGGIWYVSYVGYLYAREFFCVTFQIFQWFQSNLTFVYEPINFLYVAAVNLHKLETRLSLLTQKARLYFFVYCLAQVLCITNPYADMKLTRKLTSIIFRSCLWRWNSAKKHITLLMPTGRQTHKTRAIQIFLKEMSA